MSFDCESVSSPDGFSAQDDRPNGRRSGWFLRLGMTDRHAQAGVANLVDLDDGDPLAGRVFLPDDAAVQQARDGGGRQVLVEVEVAAS